MTRNLLVAAATAAIVTASGFAMAQEDHNNPAPSYSAMAPVKNQNVKHIQDGNNGAPRYPVTASKTPSNKSVAHIQDGNNPAPRYGGGTATTAKPTGTATTKKRGNQG
jgi:hypothetical protein